MARWEPQFSPAKQCPKHAHTSETALPLRASPPAHSELTLAVECEALALSPLPAPGPRPHPRPGPPSPTMLLHRPPL